MTEGGEGIITARPVPSAGSSRAEVLHPLSPANRRRLSGPGMRTFVAIADAWRLDEQDRLLMLGLPPASGYRRWVKAAGSNRDITLPVDVLLRVSAVLGIHQALRVLHEGDLESREWLRSRNQPAVFGGGSPLELMTCGTQDGLLTVRRLLEAMSNGTAIGPGEIDRDFRPHGDGDVVFPCAGDDGHEQADTTRTE